jgi:[acyl-carrier-protein] S-malonyltransferase
LCEAYEVVDVAAAAASGDVGDVGDLRDIAIVVGPDDDVRTARALIGAADVDRREAALRGSPAAARLPRPGTSEGRQLRRWIAHCLAAQAVVETEPGADPSSDRGGEPLPASVSDALGAGSIALAVLAGSATARELAGRLTAEVTVAPEVVRRLAAARAIPRARSVLHFVDGRPVNGGRPVLVTAAELPAPLARQLAAAPRDATLSGVDSRGRTHQLTVLDDHRPAAGPTAGATADEQAELTALTTARARAFGRWLDARRELLVHPRPGYEHPADPHQPDHTHHH